MTIYNYHKKASEKLNLNNTVQAKCSSKCSVENDNLYKKASEKLNLNNTVQAKRSAVNGNQYPCASRRDATSVFYAN